jgi:hypothetical protein
VDEGFKGLSSNLRKISAPADPSEPKCQVCGKGHFEGRKIFPVKWGGELKFHLCRHCYDIIKDVSNLFSPTPAAKDATCSLCGLGSNGLQSLISLPGPGRLSICQKCLNITVPLAMNKEDSYGNDSASKQPTLVPAPDKPPNLYYGKIEFDPTKTRGLVPNPFGSKSPTKKKVLKLHFHNRNNPQKPCAFCGKNMTSQKSLVVEIGAPGTMTICEDCINDLLNKINLNRNLFAPPVGKNQKCSVCSTPASHTLPMAIGAFPERHLVCLHCLNSMKQVMKAASLFIKGVDGAEKNIAASENADPVKDSSDPKPPPTPPEAPS